MSHIVREVITPKTAAKYLQNNIDNNRNIRPEYVKKLARDMKNGNWISDNPNAVIVFSEDGKLIDGQHRLSAIVQSGVPILSYVSRDNKKDLFFVIDSGKPRTDADRMKIAGKHEIDNRAIALLRVIYGTFIGTPSASVSMSSRQFFLLAEMLPNVVRFSNEVKKKCTSTNATLTLAMIRASIHGVKDEVLFAFGKAFVKGIIDQSVTGVNWNHATMHDKEEQAIKAARNRAPLYYESANYYAKRIYAFANNLKSSSGVKYTIDLHDLEAWDEKRGEI